MKNTLKKVARTMLLFSLIYSSAVAQKDSARIVAGKNGYRIYTGYFGTLASLPKGGLNHYVSTGAGIKFGSLFYFSKSGFANGLLNIGLKTEWINAEFNFPHTQYAKTGQPQFSAAMSQNYGPQFTISPTKSLYIDLFYTPGWGFRIFPNYKTYYNETINTSQVRLNFSQALGFSVRYYGFYGGVNLQSLANPKFMNGVGLSRFSTVQVTLGVCGWNRKK